MNIPKSIVWSEREWISSNPGDFHQAHKQHKQIIVISQEAAEIFIRSQICGFWRLLDVWRASSWSQLEQIRIKTKIQPKPHARIEIANKSSLRNALLLPVSFPVSLPYANGLSSQEVTWRLMGATWSVCNITRANTLTILECLTIEHKHARVAVNFRSSAANLL